MKTFGWRRENKRMIKKKVALDMNKIWIIGKVLWEKKSKYWNSEENCWIRYQNKEKKMITNELKKQKYQVEMGIE